MFLGMEAHPEGLPSKEFNKHLDALLTTGMLNPDILPYMNYQQMLCINEVKKALVRLEKKDARETT